MEAYGFQFTLTIAFLLYATATILRIWMAHQERFESTDGRTWPTLGTLKMSVGRLIGMLLGGGVVTWLFITDGARDISFRLIENLEPIYLEQLGGLSLFQIGQLRSLLGFVMMVFTVLAGLLSGSATVSGL